MSGVQIAMIVLLAWFVVSLPVSLAAGNALRNSHRRR